jgi:hypothetical protein
MPGDQSKSEREEVKSAMRSAIPTCLEEFPPRLLRGSRGDPGGSEGNAADTSKLTHKSAFTLRCFAMS